MVLNRRTLSSVLCKSCTLNFLNFLKESNIDTFGIIDPACGIGTCNRLCTKLLSLLDSVDSNVTRTGNCNCLALQVNAVALEHLFCHVKKAVARSFCSCE